MHVYSVHAHAYNLTVFYIYILLNAHQRTVKRVKSIKEEFQKVLCERLSYIQGYLEHSPWRRATVSKETGNSSDLQS